MHELHDMTWRREIDHPKNLDRRDMKDAKGRMDRKGIQVRNMGCGPSNGNRWTVVSWQGGPLMFPFFLMSFLGPPI
jgi:hypothetical protein